MIRLTSDVYITDTHTRLTKGEYVVGDGKGEISADMAKMVIDKGWGRKVAAPAKEGKPVAAKPKKADK